MLKKLKTWLYYTVLRLFDDAEFIDVMQFNHKFGFLVQPTPVHLDRAVTKERYDFMMEELDEFYTAYLNDDLEGMADALVDLVYVAKGTALMMGLPWRSLWDDVQRANLAKVRGMTHRGSAYDCAKPEGWQGPRTAEILAYHGYNPDEWFIGYETPVQRLQYEHGYDGLQPCALNHPEKQRRHGPGRSSRVGGLQ